MAEHVHPETPQLPLGGLTVVEFGAGIAGAYCTKLFADMGATVLRIVPSRDGEQTTHGIEAPLTPDAPQTAGLYASYLNAGKIKITVEQARGAADLVVIGEDTDTAGCPVTGGVATLTLRWFGTDGPLADWHGSELAVQAMSGQLHPVGTMHGPPLYPGPHHATTLAGVNAYVAGLASLIGYRGVPVALEVSVLEAIMALSEYQICLAESLGEALPRLGINRFRPTCPVSIHACEDGWIGITPITPAQWRALCEMLELPELGADPALQMTRDRAAHVDRIEAAFDLRFKTQSAQHWARRGRELKVPMVVVPDAKAILDHPIFNARDAFASFEFNGARYRVPRTPFALARAPARADLNSTSATNTETHPTHATPAAARIPAEAPLAGVRVIDFSMGWAGPLASRILSDYGAEVIKIEAGRYPDWWRSVDWSPAAIAAHQYETSRHFGALNRGKKSVSLDLTTQRGLTLARALVSGADTVIENQAAGVMARLGLGYEALSADHPRLVMLSMCAFGGGNAWSETRAYGSVLEQGSGLPHFAGTADAPPMLSHLAYGDPVGGLYGAASLMTALYQRQRDGQGQWINAAQIEAMLPLTTPALLARQALGKEPERRGNRHPHYVPHGCFACAGEDRWLALAVDDESWPRLACLLDRSDLGEDPTLNTGAGRRLREDEIESAVATWACTRDAADAAAQLQGAGVSAAAVAHVHEVTANEHLHARAFFHEVHRQYLEPQLQCGLPVRVESSQRFTLRAPAPLLGQHSRELLIAYTEIDQHQFDELVATGIVSLQPTALRK